MSKHICCDITGRHFLAFGKKFRILYQVAFVGNSGYTFRGFDQYFANFDDCKKHAREWDGFGLRYGAFAKIAPCVAP